MSAPPLLSTLPELAAAVGVASVAAPDRRLLHACRVLVDGDAREREAYVCSDALLLVRGGALDAVAGELASQGPRGAGSAAGGAGYGE